MSIICGKDRFWVKFLLSWLTQDDMAQKRETFLVSNPGWKVPNSIFNSGGQGCRIISDKVIQEQAASGPILADQIIRLSSPKGQASYPEPLRRVHYRDPETGKEYVFLTNRLDLSALEVAELYRRRWQIELFFKWIKQNLKIKAF